VIEDVKRLMEADAKERGVLFIEKLADNLPPVEADPNQMKQVLLNLVKNGFEALDQGGAITLSSGADHHQVWFSVHDTGMGIPRDSLEKIFNPFFTTKEKGSGLGLAVIHKIITDHHGAVAVESTPGQGTSFTVKLPVSG
jgi:signal transduction histidine kinase